MSVLRLQEVTYAYPGGQGPSLSGVDLEVQEGEVCLLAGLSGQGKSTLLRAACGLVPHFHGGTFAGSVTVCGHDTRKQSPAKIGADVAVLFQDPETQLVMSSVRAELALPLESRGIRAAAVARSVEEVALAIGVDHLLDRRCAELSGGEKQRVALAASLVGRPRLVLLDEPTSQLDPVAGEELIGLLRRLNEEWETTILLAEHRLERCLHIADRVICLDDGRIAHDGDPRSFLAWAACHARPLQTPAARLLELMEVEPPPTGVRQARASLRASGLLPRREATAHEGAAGDVSACESQRRRWRRRRHSPPALSLRGVWHELREGPVILRGVDLELIPGESVALMGRNGAGKSTLLRHAAGLMRPTRGSVHSSGRVALLLQNPGDYFLHDRVELEASADALTQAGLTCLRDRNPRDLSGGERQRLALAIVTDADCPPAVVALDEPTRGMDRAAKQELATELRGRAQQGQAVIVATHDPEFAAACATRAVLLADGRVIADGKAADLLAGGWYFATETARILGDGIGALLPEQAAELLGGAHAQAPGPPPREQAPGAAA